MSTLVVLTLFKLRLSQMTKNKGSEKRASHWFATLKPLKKDQRTRQKPKSLLLQWATRFSNLCRSKEVLSSQQSGWKEEEATGFSCLEINFSSALEAERWLTCSKTKEKAWKHLVANFIFLRTTMSWNWLYIHVSERRARMLNVAESRLKALHSDEYH